MPCGNNSLLYTSDICGLIYQAEYTAVNTILHCDYCMSCDSVTVYCDITTAYSDSDVISTHSGITTAYCDPASPCGCFLWHHPGVQQHLFGALWRTHSSLWCHILHTAMLSLLTVMWRLCALTLPLLTVTSPDYPDTSQSLSRVHRGCHVATSSLGTRTVDSNCAIMISLTD